MASRLVRAGALVLAAASTATAFELLWNVAGAPGIDLSPFPLIKQGQVELFTTYLGMLPVIQASGRWCNGGLPQLANVSLHTAKVRHDVLARISASFGGLVVVDYEAWTGSWNSTAELYRNASVALAAAENPSLPPSQLEGVAMRAFNEAAQGFLVDTLDAVRVACPSCRVGLYGYPTRAYWGGYCSPDGPRLRNVSDSMLSVFAASDALFPSIYQFYPKETRARNKQYVDCNLGEAVRLSTMFSPAKPVYAYGWPRYHTASVALLNPSDTDLEFAEPGRVKGVSGGVIWGDAASNATYVAELQAWMQANSAVFTTPPAGTPGAASGDAEAWSDSPSTALGLDALEEIARKARSRSASSFPPPWRACGL